MNSEELKGCDLCSLSRRRFVKGCAVCAELAWLGSFPGVLRAGRSDEKVRIRIVYSLHGPKQTRPDWPNVGFDFRPVMERFNRELAGRCKQFEFSHSMASGPEQAKKILDEDKSAAIDGYLVFQMNCWNRVVQTMAASGKPVLYADFKYAGSGGFLVYTAGFIRRGLGNVGFVCSSRIEDVAEAVKCFRLVKQSGNASGFAAAVAKVRVARTPGQGDLTCRADRIETLSASECLERMKDSKILAVRNQQSGPAAPIMGITVQRVSFAELNEAWKAADKDEARSIAQRWEKSAARVEGVTGKTLEESAAMYLAQRAVLKKHNANAIAINCLGGFYGGHIHAYPCLGFHELNNQGLVGACECDLRSAATMVAVTALTRGRPGFISDPVIDTASRHIIYAHCVAPNRVFGPAGPTNPFEILTHSEDRQGASVRSLLPPGYMTTTVEFSEPRKEVLLHRGKAVGNDTNDRACRTKLVAEPVGDIEKLLTMWDVWGWHRVTFYGDLAEPISALAEALGYKVVHEA